MGKDLCQAEEEEEHNGRFESWESQADIRIMDYNGNRIRGTERRRDGRSDGRTDGQTRRVIEMLRRI